MEFIGKLMYLMNTILCAVLVRYLTNYVTILGSYYVYMLRDGRMKELQTSYTPFRADSNTKILCRVCLTPQVVFAVVSPLLNHSTHPPPVQVYALAILPTFLTIHIITGFEKVKERMVSGKRLMEPEIDPCTKPSLLLHLVYAALYLIGTTWLVAVPF